MDEAGADAHLDRADGQVRRAFVAGPFTSTLDETGMMRTEDRRFISALVDCVESAGYDVCNAHRRELWGQALMTPKECVPLDLEGIRSADLFVVLPGNPASGGVHIEIGWASAHGVPTVLLLEEQAYYSPLIIGLEMVARVWTIQWQSHEDCLDQLERLLAESCRPSATEPPPVDGPPSTKRTS